MQWRDRAIDMALILTEGLWIFAILMLAGNLTGLERSPLSFFLSFVLLGSAFYVSRTLNQVAASEVVLRSVGAIVGAGIIFFALSIQLAREGIPLDTGWPLNLGETSMRPTEAALAIAASVVLWWRGSRLSQTESSAETLRLSFRIGVVVMALLVVVSAVRSADFTPLLLLFPFFGVSLGGLALANIKPDEEEKHGLSLGNWARILLFTILGILVTSATFSLLASSQVGQILSGIVGLVGYVVERILYVVFLGMGYLAELLLNLIFTIMRWLGLGGREFKIDAGGFQILDELRKRNQEEANFPQWLANLIQWGFISLVVSGILFWLARALLLRNKERTVSPSEERESVWEDDSLSQDLSSLLGRLWSNLAGRGKPPSPNFNPLSITDGITLMYVLYTNLLALARSRGIERQGWETPFELQPALASIFPADSVERISSAFVRARYGAQAPSPEEVAQLRVDWDRVRTPVAQEPQQEP